MQNGCVFSSWWFFHAALVFEYPTADPVKIYAVFLPKFTVARLAAEVLSHDIFLLMFFPSIRLTLCQPISGQDKFINLLFATDLQEK
jgi:hypothetical protein